MFIPVRPVARHRCVTEVEHGIALFDLDYTLLGGDATYQWIHFLIDRGALDRETCEAELERFYRIAPYFPVGQDAWILVLERHGDRGATAIVTGAAAVPSSDWPPATGSTSTRSR